MINKSRRILLWSNVMVLLCGSITFGEEGAKPQTKIDYVAKVNELCKAGRDENLNAFPYYKKAAALSVSWTSKTDRLDANQAELEKFVSSNKQALEQAELGLQKPYCWPKYEGASLWSLKAEYLFGVKNIAYTLCARAMLNARKGDYEKAYSDLILCYKFGQHWMGSRALIEQLIGNGIKTYSIRTGFHVMKVITSQLDSLESIKKELWLLKTKRFEKDFAELVSQDNQFPDYKVEKYQISEVIQVLSRDLDDYNNIIPFPKIETPNDLDNFFKKTLTYTKPQFREESRSWTGRLNKQQTLDSINGFYQNLDSANKQTPWQLHKQGKDISKTLDQMRKDNLYLGAFIPAAERVYLVYWTGRADADALLVTTSLLCYNTEHNQYPETLEALVEEGYLSKLPLDPFSDKPFVYKKTDSGFILYSVGIDFEDNGGKPGEWFDQNKNCDHVFWPVQEQKENSAEREIIQEREIIWINR